MTSLAQSPQLDLPFGGPAGGQPIKTSEGSLTLAEATKLIVTWADTVLPGRTVIDALIKLNMEEIPELLSSINREGAIDPEELGDVAILLFDIAHLAGIDLQDAILKKLEINRNRQWEIRNGILHHVETE